MTSIPMIDPSMARSGNADAEMRSRQREIEQNRRNLNGGDPKTKEQKLRESCEGFEAMFLQKIWEGMRASLPKDGLMQSRDEKHWQGMYDQELGKSMAKAGGIGLADMMVSQLSRNLQSASDVAAGSLGRRRPMDIAPAPLLVEPEPVPQATAVPIVAADPKAAQKPAQVNSAQSSADMYSDAAAVAPNPDAAETAGVPGSAVAGAGTSIAPPPEVRSALSSLATLATQAEVAKGIGQQTVSHINGQNVNPANFASPVTPGAPQAGQPAQSRYPQGVDPASVNAPPPVMPSTEPRTPVRTSTNNRGQVPNDDVQHFTRTQRQTGGAAQANQSSRANRASRSKNDGPELATNAASRVASPFNGQNLPPASSELVGDIATELLKSQLGDPTVKTRL